MGGFYNSLWGWGVNRLTETLAAHHGFTHPAGITGRSGGIQDDHQQTERHTPEKCATEFEVSAVWLSMLLLYPWSLSGPSFLPQ